jgi:hypothetical protein
MGQMIDFSRPDGRKTKGYFAQAGAGRPGIVVIQEWWGLNDQICGVADRFARAGYNALAPDLYEGRVTQKPDEANHLMTGLDFPGAAHQDIRGAVQYLVAHGGKVGVMVEVGANNAASVNTEEFKQLLRDVTLQIAAASPVSVSRNEVPQDIVDKEREIASQSDALKGKPAAAMESILKGKLNKYFETNCLLEQGFVKNPDLKVEAHLGAVSKQLGDTITIRRFLRFQIGE